MKSELLDSKLPSFFKESINYLYNVFPAGIPTDQKRAPDHITYRCEPLCDC